MTGTVGFGFVLQKEFVDFIFAKNGFLKSPQNHLTVAEILTCREALSWIKSNNLLNIRLKLTIYFYRSPYISELHI